MKHKILLMAVGFAALLVASCKSKPFTPDRELLYGKWQTSDGTYYRFDRSSRQYMIHDSTTVSVNGAKWQPSDDVTEDEAQPFIWTLEDAALTVTHQGYMGEKVPKSYTVTALTQSDMTWNDTYGKSTQLAKR